MATVTIMDPVTRIEGHLKVELTIDRKGAAYQVTNARCTGTLFRGFETILKGRDAWDAPILTARICGVCPVSHSLAAVKALDAATGRKPPANGRLIRNLVLGANYLQSHILHFYLLAALDYAAGPGTAPWAPAWDLDLRPGGEAIVTNLAQAVEARRLAHQMGSIFGGRMPLPHTFVSGGATAVPTAERVAQFRDNLNWLTDFIRSIYIPDVELLARLYPDYLAIGKGSANLLSYGVFDLSDTSTKTLLARGVVAAAAPGNVKAFVADSITESVRSSWYADSTDNLKPSVGATVPQYPKTGAYSWLKAPRYGGLPHETGALARMWVTGDYRRGVSVMDRHLARAREALKVALAMGQWLDQLAEGQPVHNPQAARTDGNGLGLTEAPRGALGHWVQVKSGKIAFYQVVTPTCWNASPRDGKGVPGPMEQALIGTPVADPQRPIEALRVIHSFDPCLSCAVHVMMPGRAPTVVHRPG